MKDELFEQAINALGGEEGGWVKDSRDKGGETKFGISKHQYPDLDIASLTWDKAKAIYFTDFWMPLFTKNLPPKILLKVFDMSVNFGLGHATLVLQRALRACADPTVRVDEDSKLGPKTVNAVQRAPVNVLLAALRSEQASHYRVVVTADPSQAVFLDGWLARAYS